MKVKVIARSSALSQAQVKEVQSAIQEHYPQVLFNVEFVQTIGDRDQKISLKELYKTDLFTRELDNALIEKRADIAVHSAKDLPEPLPQGLECIAITKGVDSSDSLVIREDLTWQEFAINPKVGTSSFRREKAVLKEFPNAKFFDIRGVIEDRLKLIYSKKLDGVVIAEAALIRLGLTDLKRRPLFSPVENFQGQLAILTQTENSAMKELFSILDVRPQVALSQ